MASINVRIIRSDIITVNDDVTTVNHVLQREPVPLLLSAIPVPDMQLTIKGLVPKTNGVSSPLPVGIIQKSLTRFLTINLCMFNRH